jgi:hypothetical protein
MCAPAPGEVTPGSLVGLIPSDADQRGTHHRHADELMSALEFVATLRRRWYVLALVGLCTIVGILAVHKRSIAYEGCGSFYVSGGAWYQNAYLDGNLSLPMVTGMITQAVMSQPVQQRILSTGVVADYSVTETNTSGDIRFPAYTQPTLQACASSSSSQGVVAAAQLVTSDLRGALRQMQVTRHVPQRSLIQLVTLTPAVPSAIYGRPSLAYLGVLLFGAVSGIALTVWIDPVLTRLNKRQSWWSRVGADRAWPMRGNFYRRTQGSKG